MSNEKYKIEDLLELFKVPTLDTMDEWEQVIKIDYNKSTHSIVLILDRIHKKDVKLSKPLGYVNLNVHQTFMLCYSLVSALYSMTNLDKQMLWDSFIKDNVSKVLIQ